MSSSIVAAADVVGKVKAVDEELGVGLGDGERDREIRLNRDCAERWLLLLDVVLDTALVTARSGRAAALASARVGEVVEASVSEGWSSGVDVELANGFHIYEKEMGRNMHE